MSHDPQALWDTLRKGLAQRLPERTFADWIEPCSAINFDGTTLLIQVPSPSARIWIEQQLAEEFHDVLVQSDLASLRLGFMVAGDAKPAKPGQKPKAATSATPETPVNHPFPRVSTATPWTGSWSARAASSPSPPPTPWWRAMASPTPP